MTVGVKILDRQLLHVAEHFFTKLLKRALRYYCHHLGVKSTGYQAYYIHYRQDCHIGEYLCRN